ncbi:MAG: hypothetical protein M0D57_07705 [Sphingobacteriales bacterium JAD_PAG50586_3]|nr:MAG: hypothetical protein M0D57_07705 [Sphingobacteriales bacterium JAD_PAG50586_3]
MISPEDSFSCGDPALSPTEDTLFFSSDMPGGQGGTDIWYVTYDKKKKSGAKLPTLALLLILLVMSVFLTCTMMAPFTSLLMAI